jgi:hypothetical protein
MDRKMVGEMLGVALLAGLLLSGGADAAVNPVRVISAVGFPQRVDDKIQEPDHYDTILGPRQEGTGQEDKVPSLGSGGEIVVDMGKMGPIEDGKSYDFRVVEHGGREKYWVLGAQDLAGPWVFIGYGKGTQELDLADTPLRWARYLALADCECIDEGELSEGADFDTVEALNVVSSIRRRETLAWPKAEILIGKWKYDGRFNSKPKSLYYLVEACDAVLGPVIPNHFDYVDETDWAKMLSCPVLFMTGHRDFILSERQRLGLRDYVAKGGFIFGVPCCGDARFLEAFEREMKATFTGSTFTDVPPEHALYNMPHQVASTDMPLTAMEVNEKTAVVLSKAGLVCVWEKVKCPCDPSFYDDEEALNLGVNVVLYGLTRFQAAARERAAAEAAPARR